MRKANKARSHPAGLFRRWSTWTRHIAVATLCLRGSGRASLAMQPVERVQHEGVDSFVLSHADPSARIRIIHIEALADAATHLLRSLTTSVEEHGGIRRSVDHVTVLAYNEPIPEEKFVVSDTLTEDGRIGKVTDAQGIVAVQAGPARALDARPQQPAAQAGRLGTHRCPWRQRRGATPGEADRRDLGTRNARRTGQAD